MAERGRDSVGSRELASGRAGNAVGARTSAPERTSNSRRGLLGVAACVLLPALILGCSSTASAEPVLPFGPSAFALSLTESAGSDEAAADLQAGGHPYDLAAKIELNSVVRDTPEGKFEATSVQDLRDVVIDLPLGLAGSAIAAPTCTLHELTASREVEEQEVSDCPADSAVGYIHTEPKSALNVESTLYNVVPEPGVAAEFGYLDLLRDSHVLYASIAPTSAGYVLRITARELPQTALTGLEIELYGDPAAHARAGEHAVHYATSAVDVPIFTSPSDCTGEPLKTTLYMDSWQAPGSYNADGTPDFSDPRWVAASADSPPVTGCEALAGLFEPEIEARPETTQSAPGVEADSPAALEVDLKVPQQQGVQALGTPPLKDASVTLPEGMTIAPSAANGLQACSEAQIGYLGKTPASPGELEDFNAFSPERISASSPETTCPSASKLGLVEMTTPLFATEGCKQVGKSLLECEEEEQEEAEKAGPRRGVPLKEKTPLRGSIYLARQGENPFGSLLAGYLVIDDARTGVLLKIPAELTPDPATGRLTLVLSDTPQLPFSELKIHFFAGNTALLKTPATCGSYAVSSELTPWSAPASGPAATPTGSFEVTQGAGGGTCASPQPFAPSFQAGTSSSQAGGASSFSATFSRQDSEQSLGAIAITTPPGLLGMLGAVPLCPEPQAAQGQCGQESEIGEATVAAGVGPAPYWLHGGRVYLTGPYNGAPFGLSIVVPATAGPLDLGNVVVRGAIAIDPHTAQLTISATLPQMLDSVEGLQSGIPADLRTLNITIDRPGFISSPTSCNMQAVTGTVTGVLADGAQGATVSSSTPFEAQGCKSLGFKPKLTVLTQGKTSIAKGASLKVKLAFTGTPQDAQANLAKLKIDLPKQLPTRLTTLQKACRKTVFAANPAGCPASSVVGQAKVVTPVLPGALEGPAYFVSNGDEAFPNLEIVLQGDGVRIDLVGETNVESRVSSTTFKTLPDVPIATLELTLPEGPYSALDANGNLCLLRKTVTVKKRVTVTVKGHRKIVMRNIKKTQPATLRMPTSLVAQNGAQLKQTTQVGITGCPASRKANRR
jgi:hypothetical protein